MKRLLNQFVKHVVKPTCGSCGGAIAADDINLSRQEVLCRACGAITRFETPGSRNPLEDALEDWSPDTDPPAAPRKPSLQVTYERDRLVLSRRTGNIAAGIFMTLWLTGWTAGCVFLVAKVIEEPTLEMTLFAIPFVASWVFVFFFLAWTLFGVERLTIGPEGLVRESFALIRIRRRVVALRDITGIHGRLTEGSKEILQFGLEIRTSGRNIAFGKGGDPDELVWAADLILRQVHTLAPHVLAARSGEREPGSPDAPQRIVDSDRITLHSRDDWREQPSDSTVKLRREYDRLVFSRAGWHDFSTGAFFGCLFLCCFWNGIVSVFVYALISGEATQDMGSGGFWFLFVFLIPFEVIGLGILSAFLAILLCPLTRRVWTFGREVRSRFEFLGIGRTRIREWQPVSRCELRRDASQGKWAFRSASDTSDSDRCALALVGADNTDLVVIRPLTEGEARWIAGELHTEFAGSFVHRRR